MSLLLARSTKMLGRTNAKIDDDEEYAPNIILLYFSSFMTAKDLSDGFRFSADGSIIKCYDAKSNFLPN